MASNSKAVTGTAVMARSANEKKKKKSQGDNKGHYFQRKTKEVCPIEPGPVCQIGNY